MNVYLNNSERPATSMPAVIITRHLGHPVDSGFDENERPVRVDPELARPEEKLDAELAAYLAQENVALAVPLFHAQLTSVEIQQNLTAQQRARVVVGDSGTSCGHNE